MLTSKANVNLSNAEVSDKERKTTLSSSLPIFLHYLSVTSPVSKAGFSLINSLISKHV